MGQKKGQTGNLNGRPKGTPNKTTVFLRERIKTFLDKNWAQVERDFKKLDPQKKIIFFEKLLSYAVPKLKESDIKLNLEALTDEQLNQIIDKILQNETKD